MKVFIEKHLKKMELILAIASFFLFLVGDEIELCEMLFGMIPFIALAIVIALSNFKEINMRVFIWIFLGVKLLPFLPDLISYIADEGIDFYMLLTLIGIVLMPFLEVNVLLIYSVYLSVMWFVVMVIGDSVSAPLLANVIYYMTLSLLSYELKPSNKLRIHSQGLFDADDGEWLVDTLEEQEVGSPSTLKQKLQAAVEQKKEKIILSGKSFLFDDYEESKLTFKLKYGNAITLVAAYSYDFEAKDSNSMLKRKCLLDQTFCDIGLRAKVSVELDIDNLEEGIFSIHLLKCEFGDTDIQGLVDKMYEFMKVIILLNNSKIY